MPTSRKLSSTMSKRTRFLGPRIQGSPGSHIPHRSNPPFKRSVEFVSVEMALFGTKWHGLRGRLSHKAIPQNTLGQPKIE